MEIFIKYKIKANLTSTCAFQVIYTIGSQSLLNTNSSTATYKQSVNLDLNFVNGQGVRLTESLAAFSL